MYAYYNVCACVGHQFWDTPCAPYATKNAKTRASVHALAIDIMTYHDPLVDMAMNNLRLWTRKTPLQTGGFPLPCKHLRDRHYASSPQGAEFLS
jgi:hypothetical protein